MDKYRKVMIVEDDPLLSIVEGKLVEQIGFRVAGKAKSGEEALDRFYDISPSIILMDVQLSGAINGLEAIKNLRENEVTIPVIFLSGDDSELVKKQAHELGCVDFLLKPVSKNVLSESLHKAENSVIKPQFAA
ncbi:MAG: response regulator [Gracilimonas sp.]|jgi:YesN/AraC family two-component response regulator|nr:response regulator [Gracilimonas sp.]